MVSEGLEGLKPSASSTRRGFVRRAAVAGAGVAGLGLFGLTESAAADDPAVLAFGSAAVGAERIAVAFYSNALGDSSPFGVTADLAKRTLLNSSHREYFEAARNQEASHLATLLTLGVDFGFHTFAFPAGSFSSAKAMLALGEQLEDVFIGAYLGAIKAGASANSPTGAFVAEAAAEILGVECAHRVLIRDIAGEDPPNDRFYEGSLVPPSNALGDTGQRSTVYATADDAVNALLALGITPS